MTKYLRTFVFVGCCPLPVCATGPDFLLLFALLAKLTSWACLLDSQWLHNVLVAAVTFSDARRIYRVKLSEYRRWGTTTLFGVQKLVDRCSIVCQHIVMMNNSV